MNAQAPTHEEATAEQGRPVPVSEVKGLLEKEQAARTASGEELSYEQTLALNHATIFTRVPPDKVAALLHELRQIPRLNEWHRAKIVDVAPSHPDDVRAIFAKDRFTLENEEIDRIINAVKASVG